MMGEELFAQVTGRDHDNWLQLGDVSRKSWEMRAAGELSFIPSSHVNRVEEVSTVREMPEPEIPAHEVFHADEINGGAKIVVNRFLRNGWEVQMFVCRGPWKRQTVRIELTTMDDDGHEIVTGEERITYGQADSVLVRARRGQHRAGAVWLRKPWVKDPKWEFLFAQVRPEIGKVDSKGLKAITESEAPDA